MCPSYAPPPIQRRQNRYPRIFASTTVADIVEDAVTAARKAMWERNSDGFYVYAQSLDEIYDITLKYARSENHGWRRILYGLYCPSRAQVCIIHKHIGLGILYVSTDKQHHRFVGSPMKADKVTPTLIGQVDGIDDADVQRLLPISARQNFSVVRLVYEAFRPLLLIADMVSDDVVRDKRLAQLSNLTIESDLILEQPPRPR